MIEVACVPSPIVIAGDPHGNFPPILRACAGAGTRHADPAGRLRSARAAAPGARARCSRSAGASTGSSATRTPRPRRRSTTWRPTFPRATSAARVIEVGGAAHRRPGRRVQAAHLASARRRAGRHDRTARLQHAARLPRQPQAAANTGAAGCRCGIAIRSSRRISSRLAQHRFDVLVTHEAPSCHRHGFAAIDRPGRGRGCAADRARASS